MESVAAAPHPAATAFFSLCPDPCCCPQKLNDGEVVEGFVLSEERYVVMAKRYGKMDHAVQVIQVFLSALYSRSRMIMSVDEHGDL